METSTTSSEDSNVGNGGRLIRYHHERPNQVAKPSGLLVRLWNVPLPVRRGHAAHDSVIIIACLAILTCIAQALYIQRLKSGLVRIENDPFDNTFGQHIQHSSPEIWRNDRQAFVHKAVPIPVHSHNDYTRRIPLFEALGSGCISIEADVHLRGSDLLVGHTKSSLKKGVTLKSLYLDPLERMITNQNANATNGEWRGLFDLTPHQTVVLLVDHKTSGPETLAELHAQLQPLRDLDFLTHWNGTERVMRPLTIVASGNALFSSILALDDTRRDIFFDAKLERLLSRGDNWLVEPPTYVYNQSNSYYASTEWKNAILWSYTWTESNYTRKSQLEEAAARGLITRYWNTPSEPPNIKEIVWRVLVDRQVGILNMDDLGTVRARAKGWGKIEL